VVHGFNGIVEKRSKEAVCSACMWSRGLLKGSFSSQSIHFQGPPRGKQQPSRHRAKPFCWEGFDDWMGAY
jgi:hypothetical protein